MDRKRFIETLGLGTLMPAFSTRWTPSKSHQQIKPKPLNVGDTIGLISPAGITGEDEDYDKVIQTIRQMGYKVKEGKHAREKHGYLAGTDDQRAEDLNTMFAEPSVKAILPFRGGWGCNRILDKIDYQTVRDHPKALIGFSDITSLLLAIYTKTGLVTFHGPVAKSIWTHFTTDHFRKVTGNRGEHTLSIKERLSESYNSFRMVSPGTARGRLLGGNLTVLTAMIGSDYLPDFNNSILFIEDVGEDIYRIDRMLTQLKLSGILDQISGFILGQCTACDESQPYGFSLEEIIDQHIKPLQRPDLSGIPVGHIDHMLTLPIGIQAEINVQKGSISFLEEAVS